MMKRMNLWLLGSLLVGAMALTACSSSDDTVDPVNPVNPESGTAVKPADMKMSPLSGFVYDMSGNPMSDVLVTSGTEEVTTGRDGGFALEKVATTGGRTLVTFSKSGYIEVVRSLPTAEGSVWEVRMANNYSGDITEHGYFRANEGLTITPGGMQVAIQSNGMDVANADGTASGTAYTEYVNAQTLYLSPDEDYFADMMPGGDLAAVREDGTQAALISYGMVKVELNDNSGNKLQLTDGKPATLTFPVPDKFEDNTPAEIPLWSFNETTGLWEEEGIATYDATNDVYVGTVTHFSWVNLDYPQSRATVVVTVKDEAGNMIPNIIVDIDGQRAVTTNVNGQASCNVPINTDFYVTVRSSDYANYSPEVKKEVSAIRSAGITQNVELVLPTVAHLSGKVVNNGVGSKVATLWLEYNGKRTKNIHSDSNGLFYILAPSDYQGAAVLKVRAHDGTTKSFDVTLDGKDHAYTLEVSAKKASGGQAVAKLNDGSRTYNFTVPSCSFESLDGVSIVDGNLHFSTSAYNNSVNIYGIENYSESTSVYEGVNFSFYENNAYASSFNLDGTINNKLTITKNSDGYYRFQLEGDAGLRDYENDISTGNTANATIQADFTAPLIGKGKELGSITKKDASFPSFTPWLEGDTVTAAMQITESERLGKGVMLWYFNESLGYEDYLNLKAQAKASLGEPVLCYDFGDDSDAGGQDVSMSIFVKGGKFIMVSFCPWREDYGEKITISDIAAIRENHAARIHVHVLDGLSVDYNLFTGHFQVKGERNF